MARFTLYSACAVAATTTSLCADDCCSSKGGRGVRDGQRDGVPAVRQVQRPGRRVGDDRDGTDRGDLQRVADAGTADSRWRAGRTPGTYGSFPPPATQTVPSAATVTAALAGRCAARAGAAEATAARLPPGASRVAVRSVWSPSTARVLPPRATGLADWPAERRPRRRRTRAVHVDRVQAAGARVIRSDDRAVLPHVEGGGRAGRVDLPVELGDRLGEPPDRADRVVGNPDAAVVEADVLDREAVRSRGERGEGSHGNAQHDRSAETAAETPARDARLTPPAPPQSRTFPSAH